MDEIYVLDDADTFMDEESMLISDDYYDLSGARKQLYLYDNLQELDDSILGDGSSVDALLTSASIKTENDPENIPNPISGNDGILDSGVPLPPPLTPAKVSSPAQITEFPVKMEVEGIPKREIEEHFSEHMDIRLCVKVLRALLERRLDCDLSGYEVWLQNAEKISLDKNLVDQCRMDDGLVQISMELLEAERRINIVDVLLPTAEYQEGRQTNKTMILTHDGLQWMEAHAFLISMAEKSIPTSVHLWSQDHVRFWINWAVEMFSIIINPADWVNLTGDDLCSMTRQRFQQMVHASDEGDILWTHFNFLRKCGLVLTCLSDEPDTDEAPEQIAEEQEPGEEAEEEEEMEDLEVPELPPSAVPRNDAPHLPVAVVAPMSVSQKPKLQNFTIISVQNTPEIHSELPSLTRRPEILSVKNTSAKLERPLPDNVVSQPKKSRILGLSQTVTDRRVTSNEGLVGNNGQITLWQFLLELLTDYQYASVIHFISNDGQFILADPEQVAKLWGMRKNKPSMTYEKLSRALRYYYDGDLIAKVPGLRFVYRFVCDLKEVLGYSPGEIARNLMLCSAKSKIKYPGPTFFLELPDIRLLH